MYQLTWQSRSHWRESTEGLPEIPPPPPDRPVAKVAHLLWEEHCVECAVPECYSSCPLYVARRDQKCARFKYGIFPNSSTSGLFGYGADITFRRWGKLEAHWPNRPRLFSTTSLRREAACLAGIDRVVSGIAGVLAPINPKRRLNGAHWALRHLWMSRRYEAKDESSEMPDGLLMKFYSSEREVRGLQLEVYLFAGNPLYRFEVPMQPGWNEHVIPFSEFPANCPSPAGIKIWPSDEEPLRVVFTWLDLVQFQASEQRGTGEAKSAAKVKCVAWDLDNTLWSGVIGDAGPDGVSPNEEMMSLIKEFDRRGILQTVASKNDYDRAWPKIEALGLSEYFLYPAINWGRKSESLKQIAQKLNINIDTFAVIDDSEFERDEISSALPQVRAYDPADGSALLENNEFDVPVTELSIHRRETYLTEASRQRVAADWGEDFEGFLRSCEMVIKIERPEKAQLSRCLELLQRSNQFNLSGKRYTEESLRALVSSDSFECFAVDVRDKFGAHGIVAFMAVELGEAGPTLIDFVMSCRVAQKMVDATLLFWYAARAQQRGATCFKAHLKVTERNGPLRAVFSNLPFVELWEKDDTQLLEFQFDGNVEIPSVMQIDDRSFSEDAPPEATLGHR